MNIVKFSNNATFASSDHRLMALRIDIPVNSNRRKYDVPSKLSRALLDFKEDKKSKGILLSDGRCK